MIIRIGHQKINLTAQKQKQSYSQSNGQNQQTVENTLVPQSEQKIIQQERQLDDIKLRQYYNKLTLAQRLGLVPAPQKPLSSEDWLAIENQSKKRQDSEGCCAICLEDFKTQEQVILSCSHVFHKQCLSSFEKHNKSKVCPICRRQHYEKRHTDEGYKVFIVKCAILIQKIWRGSQVRKSFFSNLIQEKYKAESLLLRRKMLAFKLMKFSTKFTAALEQKSKNTQQVVQDIEHNIEDKKQLIEDNMQNLKHLRDYNKQQVNEFLMYESDHVCGELGDGNKNCNHKNKITQQQWAQIKEKAVIRCDKDCVICYNELCGGQKKKDLYLLSCSHVFHANCLNAFERYNLKTNQCCPICRSEYEKILFQ